MHSAGRNRAPGWAVKIWSKKPRIFLQPFWFYHRSQDNCGKWKKSSKDKPEDETSGLYIHVSPSHTHIPYRRQWKKFWSVISGNSGNIFTLVREGSSPTQSPCGRLSAGGECPTGDGCSSRCMSEVVLFSAWVTNPWGAFKIIAGSTSLSKCTVIPITGKLLKKTPRKGAH